MCTDLQQWVPALWGRKNLLKLNTFHGSPPGELSASTMPMDPWPWQFLHGPHLEQVPGRVSRILGREEDPTAGLRGAWKR